MIIRIIYLLGASIVTIIQFETVSKEQKLSEYILGFPSLGIITLEERHLFWLKFQNPSKIFILQLQFVPGKGNVFHSNIKNTHQIGARMLLSSDI